MKKLFITVSITWFITFTLAAVWMMVTQYIDGIVETLRYVYMIGLFYAFIPYLVIGLILNLLEYKILKNVKHPISLFILRFLLFSTIAYTVFFFCFNIDFNLFPWQYKDDNVTNSWELFIYTLENFPILLLLILIYIITCELVYKGKVVKSVFPNDYNPEIESPTKEGELPPATNRTNKNPDRYRGK